jgi:hypothetical protein
MEEFLLTTVHGVHIVQLLLAWITNPLEEFVEEFLLTTAHGVHHIVQLLVAV